MSTNPFYHDGKCVYVCVFVFIFYLIAGLACLCVARAGRVGAELLAGGGGGVGGGGGSVSEAVYIIP